MNIENNVLKNDEKIIFSLRSLYSKYGYSQFKMSKFEEYDLYVRNKDFLVSDSIITFTDTNGKLLALKPDVTFSIIKNTDNAKGSVQRYFYNENVYRVSKSTNSFKEIMQTGLECIGDVDDYCISEVLSLAVKSLKSISDDCILAVAYLDFVSEIIESFSVSSEIKTSLMKCISEKNTHEISDICTKKSLDKIKIEALKELISIYGKAVDVLPKVKNLLSGIVSKESIEKFEKIITLVSSNGYEDMMYIDFSVVSDMKYYNGFVFKGFINGIPGGVLSGGQYDKLMKKFGSKSSAIGFAVYLDMLDRYNLCSREFDIDTVLLYDDSVDLNLLRTTAEEFSSKGSVMVQKILPERLKYKTLVKLQDNEVTVIENNA